MRVLIIGLLSLFMVTTVVAKESVLFDVREESEIKAGMLKGALWFPLSRVQQDKDWSTEFLKMANGKSIELYCRSGQRASIVQAKLKEIGVEAKNLGGYEDLRRERGE